jgi:hypothetical protein
MTGPLPLQPDGQAGQRRDREVDGDFQLIQRRLDRRRSNAAQGDPSGREVER